MYVHTYMHKHCVEYTFYSEGGDSGQQCCYDRKNGRLKTGPPEGGTVSRYSPRKNPFLYAAYDYLPRYLCCDGFFANCDAFYKKRPSDNGSRYQLRLPGIYVHTYAYTYVASCITCIVLHISSLMLYTYIIYPCFLLRM